MDTTTDKKQTILVVDDNPNNLRVVADFLKGAGYTVAVASSGSTAITRAMRIRPLVILLDVKMPDINGFDVCRALKKSSEIHSIPVIFLTALDNNRSLEEGFQAGGVDYITKPIQKEELLARVATQVENYLYKNHLEAEVNHRTTALEAANKRLKAEISSHLETSEKLRTLLDLIGDGVIATDREGNIVRMNKVAENLTGWSKDQAKGAHLSKVLQLVDSQTRQVCEDPVNSAIRNVDSSSLSHHMVLTSKLGKEYQVIEYTAPIKDSTGAITGVVVGFRDVTAEHQVREDLRRSEERLDLAMFGANDGVWDWHLSEDKLFFDARYYTMAGYEPNEFPSKFEEWAKRVHPEDIRKSKSAVEKYLAGQSESFETEFRFLQKNGSYMWIRGRGKAADYNALGNPVRFIGTHSDITKLKQTEEALQQVNQQLDLRVHQRTNELNLAKIEAEEANQAKSSFLTTMSHELRSPLNTLLGFSKLLWRDAAIGKEHLSASQQENLSIIHRSGQHLLTLINNVLELSRIEAGHVVTNTTHCDLIALLKGLEEMFMFKAQEKGLSLQLELTADLPSYVNIDEVKLRQILINILDNAIKFTNHGAVTLNVSVSTPDNAPEKGSSVALCFAISDTGVGIAEDEIDLLFSPFSQTKSGKQLQIGTGLGLHISRQFVRIMGGEINVQSQTNKGTTFTFLIPVEITNAPPVSHNRMSQLITGMDPSQPKYRILIVDDNADGRMLFRKLLKPMGFELSEAKNGQQAIESWKEFQPHLVWMNLHLPGVNGYAAAQYIKDAAGGEKTKIIALTTGSHEDERCSHLDTNFDDYLRKPFQETRIFEMMARLLGAKYHYHHIDALPSDLPSLDTLSTDHLAVLPDALLTQLYQAALELSPDKVLGLIDEVKTYDTDAAAGFTNLIRNYDFVQLIDVIENFKESNAKN